MEVDVDGEIESRSEQLREPGQLLPGCPEVSSDLSGARLRAAESVLASACAERERTVNRHMFSFRWPSSAWT